MEANLTIRSRKRPSRQSSTSNLLGESHVARRILNSCSHFGAAVLFFVTVRNKQLPCMTLTYQLDAPLAKRRKWGQQSSGIAFKCTKLQISSKEIVVLNQPGRGQPDALRTSILI